MARIAKPQHSHHALRITSDAAGELLLVGKRRGAYLWVGRDGEHTITFSGRKTLRALAKAILAAHSDAKP